jgi:hypothetical protein
MPLIVVIYSDTTAAQAALGDVAHGRDGLALHGCVQAVADILRTFPSLLLDCHWQGKQQSPACSLIVRPSWCVALLDGFFDHQMADDGLPVIHPQWADAVNYATGVRIRHWPALVRVFAVLGAQDACGFFDLFFSHHDFATQ